MIKFILLIGFIVFSFWMMFFYSTSNANPWLVILWLGFSIVIGEMMLSEKE